MPSNLVLELEELYLYNSQIDGFKKDTFVFGADTPLADTTIERYKNQYCKLAKVKQIRIHDFRHSHASLLIYKKVDIMQVARRLGHSDIKMTWNTYSHLLPNAEEEAIKALEND